MISFDKDYYRKIMTDFGYDPFEFEYFNFSFKDINQEILQTKYLCHYKGKDFSLALKNNTPSIVTTGFGISGVPHIGTISQISRCIYFQKHSIPVQIVLGDMDAYNGKNKDLKYVLELTDRYKQFILALGFKTDKNNILRDQFTELSILKNSYMLGKYMSDDMFSVVEEDLHDLYSAQGKVDINMSYRRKLSLNLMASDFVSIGQEYNNVLVMLGVDEHKYVRFTQETIQLLKEDKNSPFKYFNLSAVYTPMIKGFNSYPKMSKSFPDSSISVTSSKDEIVDKILNSEGNYVYPEDNVVFQMICALDSHSSVDTIKDMYENCKLKNRKWVNYKLEFADYLIDLISKW